MSAFSRVPVQSAGVNVRPCRPRTGATAGQGGTTNPDRRIVVMFCGKYSPHKSPLDLVAAAHTAFQNGIPVWALLVGEGSERSAIEEYCRRKKVRNTVLTGFINQSSMPEYYVAADALAVTSLVDNHPLVVTEGACLGLPAIVSDRVGRIGANDMARPG